MVVWESGTKGWPNRFARDTPIGSVPFQESVSRSMVQLDSTDGMWLILSVCHMQISLVNPLRHFLTQSLRLSLNGIDCACVNRHTGQLVSGKVPSWQCCALWCTRCMCAINMGIFARRKAPFAPQNPVVSPPAFVWDPYLILINVTFDPDPCDLDICDL